MQVRLVGVQEIGTGRNHLFCSDFLFENLGARVGHLNKVMNLFKIGIEGRKSMAVTAAMFPVDVV